MPDMITSVSLAVRIKINEDVVWRDLQGESVLLDLRSGTYFGLDRVGTRIWYLLQEQGDLQNVLWQLLREYEVSEEQGTCDLLNLVSALAGKGLVQAQVE